MAPSSSDVGWYWVDDRAPTCDSQRLTVSGGLATIQFGYSDPGYSQAPEAGSGVSQLQLFVDGSATNWPGTSSSVRSALVGGGTLLQHNIAVGAGTVISVEMSDNSTTVLPDGSLGPNVGTCTFTTKLAVVSVTGAPDPGTVLATVSVPGFRICLFTPSDSGYPHMPRTTRTNDRSAGTVRLWICGVPVAAVDHVVAGPTYERVVTAVPVDAVGAT
jgi:hypothetical protein